MNYPQRISRLRQRMENEGVTALLVSSLPNTRYLIGFSGSNGLLLVSEDRVSFWTDSRYREQSAQEVQGARVIIPANGDIWTAAARQANRFRTVAVEAACLTLAQRQRLTLPDERLHPAVNWVEELRAVKEPEEVEAIRRAIHLASSVFEPTLEKFHPGMKETELAGHLEFALRQAGGEGLSFDTIVASGVHAALVHGRASSKPIGSKEFVILDYGVILGGYVSDMTRTIHTGPVPRRARQVYQAVLDAQLAAIAAVRPGVTCATVDAAARKVLQREGLGDAFSHSTGHGLGLEVHESPRVSRLSKQRLAPGQVITIEPGVYIPGWGGVRIEDVVLVTESGVEVLTPTTKKLLTV